MSSEEGIEPSAQMQRGINETGHTREQEILVAVDIALQLVEALL